MNKYCTKAYGRKRFFEIMSLERALDFLDYWYIREFDIHVITPFCYE